MKKRQTFAETGPEDASRQPRLDETGRPEEAGQGGPKGKHPRRRLALYAVLGVLAVLLVALGVYAYRILKRPESLFAQAQANVTEAPKKERMESLFDLDAYATPTADPARDAATAAPATDAPATNAPEATDAPEATEAPQQMDNIVNVMLMGIDAFESGGTTSGNQPHTDVMMVVAINFDKDTVDLITLPRDIFTTAPGYHGYYKLNGVFNVGLGGWDRSANTTEELDKGFSLTCRAAEIWLGGITIPYYYAVDFKAVVDIVDAIGGIDYDVDQAFIANRPDGYSMNKEKYYTKGMHHLDGAAVLGYLRIRHDADGLDSSRTARQRRMMVAIYRKLRTEGKLSQVPALISAVNSGVYTNTTLAQTTALVNYAKNTIEPEQIRTRSVYGDIWYQHYFKYCFVDQQNRIDIIREVYGIDAEPIGVNTPQYENWLYDIGFQSLKFVRQPEKVFQVIQTQKEEGKTFTDEQIAAYAACYQAYVALDEGFAACSERVQKAYVDNSLTEAQIQALEAEVKAELTALNKAVKETTVALAKACDIHTRLQWTVDVRWFADLDINEAPVTFG